jgi:APA family basic amino acid/polyamine antiporter
MTRTDSTSKIGLWTSTALVVGNMIGSGIFLLPAALAAYGAISFIGWICSSLGAVALALLFSHLSKMFPNSTGGPYAYSREGLGDFAGFLVAWGYWLSTLCTNAAIAVAFVSYLSVFIPALSDNSFFSVSAGLSAIWFLTWINTRGIKTAGMVQVITTVMKLTPLVLLALVGVFYIDSNNFVPFNASGESTFNAIAATTTLTLFAFLGLESATIPSENIRDPEKTIPRATIIGTAMTIIVYILGSITVMGMLNPEQLQKSNAPFADAAALIWGDQARSWVALGAIVSTFGALNGWILVQGQVPLAAARDRLFPHIFSHENKKNVPAIGIIISSVLISGLMLMNFTKGLTDTFQFMLLLSTVTVLVPYLFSAASYGLILLQNKLWKKTVITKVLLALIAFIYSMWAVAGSGQESVYWGFIGLMAGIPFYVWMKRASPQDHS